MWILLISKMSEHWTVQVKEGKVRCKNAGTANGGENCTERRQEREVEIKKGNKKLRPE